MNPPFNSNYYFLKKQTGLLSVTQYYEVYDWQTRQQIFTRQEFGSGFIRGFLRFIGYTASIPFTIQVSSINGDKLFTVKRRFSLFRPAIKVFDASETLVGIIIRSAWWAFLADQFKITNIKGEKLCGFNENLYSFSKGDVEFAHLHGDVENLRANLIDVTDQYKMEFKASVPANDPLRILIFGAVMSIDLLVKQNPQKKILNGKPNIDL